MDRLGQGRPGWGDPTRGNPHDGYRGNRALDARRGDADRMGWSASAVRVQHGPRGDGGQLAGENREPRYLHAGSPSPAPITMGFVVLTPIPHAVPVICVCPTCADHAPA